MAPVAATVSSPDTQYPDSDGKPMFDNTKQAEWITRIFDNLRALFANDPNVFVAADNMVYPIQVEPGQKPPCQAPDVYVVFGRPKGYRGSYKYWEEDNVPVTIAFEILSPSNKPFEMADKRDFYEDYGIEEYYVYDPDTNQLQIYRRVNSVLRRVRPPDDFVSPRMGIRFDLSGEELVIRHPDGRPFVEFMEERQRADEAEALAQQTSEKLVQTSEKLVQTSEKLAQTNEKLTQTSERLARIVELGRKVRGGQATADELAELERLEGGQ